MQLLFRGILAVVAAFSVLPMTGQRVAPAPQRDFSAEDEGVKHPAYLPDEIFAQLARDRYSVIYGDGDTPLKPLREWYSAEKLRSPGRNVELYLVQACGPITGANTVHFWLVQQNTQNNKVDVLWDASELSVSLRYPSGASYPDIHAMLVARQLPWQVTLSYRAGKYVVIRSNERQNQKKLDAAEKTSNTP